MLADHSEDGLDRLLGVNSSDSNGELEELLSSQTIEENEAEEDSDRYNSQNH